MDFITLPVFSVIFDWWSCDSVFLLVVCNRDLMNSKIGLSALLEVILNFVFAGGC